MRYLLLLAVAVAAHGQFGAATSVVSGNGAPVAAQCTNANNVGRVWARKDGGAASTTFYICAATGAGTYGWQLNDGAIGGAGNIASGQVLYGTGAGVAGTSSLFAFDGQRMRVGAAAGADGSALIGTSGALGGIWLNTSTGSPGVGNYVLLRDAGQNTVLNTETGSYIGFRINNVDFGRLFPSGNWGLGTTTDDGTNRLQVAGSVAVTLPSAAAFGTYMLFDSNTGSDMIISASSAGVGQFGTSNNTNLAFLVNATERARFTTTGNLLLGTTTDNNFRLDIAASGSSGTLRVYDQTPTTGATQVIVRAGAGQSTTNLTTWQNASGTALAVVSATGSMDAAEFYQRNDKFWVTGANTNFASDAFLRFSSTTSAGGSKDVSLSRAGVNIGQLGDGGSNSNGLLYLKGVRPVGSTVANLPAAAGNTGMMATVTDANATTIGTTVAGGGSDTVLVWSNGTNWRIYAN
jgi:hypothetical protein